MLHQALVSLNQCPAMSQARFNASASDAEARDCTFLSNKTLHRLVRHMHVLGLVWVKQ